MQLNFDRQSRLHEYFGMCQHDIFGMCHLHFPRSSTVRPLCTTREHLHTVRKSRLDLRQELEQLFVLTNPARAPARTNTSCDYYFVKSRSKSYNLSYPIILKHLWAGLRDLCYTVWSINKYHNKSILNFYWSLVTYMVSHSFCPRRHELAVTENTF